MSKNDKPKFKIKEQPKPFTKYATIPRGWSLLPISPEARNLGCLMMSWTNPDELLPSPSLEAMEQGMGVGRDCSHKRIREWLTELESIGMINLGGSVARQNGAHYDMSVVFNKSIELGLPFERKKKRDRSDIELLKEKLIEIDEDKEEASRMSEDAITVFPYVVNSAPYSDKIGEALERLFRKRDFLKSLTHDPLL